MNTKTINVLCFALCVCTFRLSSNQQNNIDQQSSVQTDQLLLTTIAVLACPARQAFAEVSTNQVAAGLGVDAGAVRTLVRI